MTRTLAVLLVATLLPVTGRAQNAVPGSDPLALALAAKSVAALTGGVPINDVTMTGSAASVAGSFIDTGPVTLLAKDTNESSITLQLGSGTRTDIRTAAAQGAWLDASAVSHSYAAHNCLTDAAWFFPALLSFTRAGSDPSIVLSYVGQEKVGNALLEHIRYSTFIPAAANLQSLSTTDLYLDSASLLPLAIRFNVHPDDDLGLDIPVEVDFSNYQAVNGVQVPLHIQKFLQGTLVVDMKLTSATFNSGLSDNQFQVQ